MTALHSIDEVVEAISAAAAGRRRILVGIAGAPGAGKSTIAVDVVGRLGAAAALLPMDGFHLPQARLIELGRRDRMGAPDTFDADGFLAVLAALRGPDDGTPGGDVHAPGFDREIEESVPDAIVIPRTARIVVVEGNYLLSTTHGWGPTADALDLTFFVDVDPVIRRERLIARHIRFGKSPEAARDWALGPDERNAELIQATAARANSRILL